MPRIPKGDGLLHPLPDGRGSMAYQPYRGISLRKGTAGSPAAFTRLHPGSSAQPYRTLTGVLTDGLETSSVAPSTFASAGTNFPSAPAISNPPIAPSLPAIPSACPKYTRIAPFSVAAILNTGPEYSRFCPYAIARAASASRSPTSCLFLG